VNSTAKNQVGKTKDVGFQFGIRKTIPVLTDTTTKSAPGMNGRASPQHTAKPPKQSIRRFN